MLLAHTFSIKTRSTPAMVQLWKLICLDTREATSILGPMNRLLAEDIPSRLERMVTIGKHSKIISPPIGASNDGTLEDRKRPNQNDLNKVIAPWAGKRIICVSNCTGCVYPNNVLTLDELARFEGREMFGMVNIVAGPARFTIDDPNVYLNKVFACGNFRLAARLESFDDVCYPAAAEQVLRNLDLKVYVRGNANPGRPDFTLGRVLIMQICWAAESSEAAFVDNSLRRGPWAGNRFDITTARKIDRTWIDKSDEIVERYTAFYGDE